MATNPYSIQTAALEKMYNDQLQSYRDAQAAQEAQQQAQTQQTINNLEADRPKINDQYKSSAAQAYVNKMIQQRDLPQRMAALGLTGGASETSQLKLNTMYGNNMNDLTKQRDSSTNDLNLRIANARAEGDNALGTIRNNFALQMAQAQAEYNERLAEAELQRQIWEAEQEAERQRAAAAAAAAAARSRSSSSSGGGNKTYKTGDFVGPLRDELPTISNQYTMGNTSAYNDYLKMSRADYLKKYGNPNYVNAGRDASNQY